MTRMQQRASLHERAVQKVATENVKFSKPRGKSKRKPNGKVKKSHWSDGVDPRIVEAVLQLNVRQVWRYIDVISPTEIIIRNTPQR